MIPLINFAQNKDLDPIDVTHKISVDDYLKIREFILEKKEYCLHGSLYGDCPFFQINNIGIFLLSMNTLGTKIEDIPIESYNKMYIKYEFKDENEGYITPIYLLYENDKIYLTFSSLKDTKETMKAKYLLLDDIRYQILQKINR